MVIVVVVMVEVMTPLVVYTHGGDDDAGTKDDGVYSDDGCGGGVNADAVTVCAER